MPSGLRCIVAGSQYTQAMLEQVLDVTPEKAVMYGHFRDGMLLSYLMHVNSDLACDARRQWPFANRWLGNDLKFRLGSTLPGSRDVYPRKSGEIKACMLGCTDVPQAPRRFQAPDSKPALGAEST